MRRSLRSPVFPYTTLFRSIKDTWDGMWAWCKNSGTVLLARATAAFGFVVAVLSSTDWSNIFAMDFTQADRKSTRLNSSHLVISYAVFCLKNTRRVVTIRQT